jgi:hypothetical protein
MKEEEAKHDIWAAIVFEHDLLRRIAASVMVLIL